MKNGGDFSERLQRIDSSKSTSPQDGSPVRSAGRGIVHKIIAACVFFGGLAMLLAVAAITLKKSNVLGGIGESVAAIKDTISNTEMISLGSGQELLLASALEAQVNRHEDNLADAEAARRTTLIAPAEVRPAAPTAPITMDRMGSIFGSGHAATQSGDPVALNSIFTDFQPTGPESRYWEIGLYDINENCGLRPVGSDEKLVNVNVDTGHAHAPVQIINNTTIHKTIEDHTEEALADGHGIGMMKIQRGKMGVIDVIVTDTSAPLYLTLQSRSYNMMWHIHAAPGVNIAHIAMIGGNAPALTGNIGTASFEAVRGYDGLTQSVERNGQSTRVECHTTPYRKPNESWGAWEGARGGNTLDGNLLFGQDEGFDEFNSWFTENLGTSADTNLITARKAGVVLVGGVPTEPLTAPNKLTNIHVPRHDVVLTGSEFAREAEIVEIYTQFVTAAAGGDYRDILPDELILVETAADLAAPSQVSGGRRSFGDLVMNTNDIDSKVSLTELNRQRRVSFSARLTLQDLLQDGEAMPPEEQRNTYALMRAARQMMPYCADTLVEIASKCRVFKTTAHHSGDGEYQIRADFAYVPNYTIGDVERMRGGEFISAFLPDDNESRTHQTADERRAFLVQLKGICEQLRTEYGNCLIGTAGFYLDRPARFSGSGVNSNAAGWVEIYGQNNPFEEKKFQERVAEIFAGQ